MLPTIIYAGCPANLSANCEIRGWALPGTADVESNATGGGIAGKPIARPAAGEAGKGDI